mmetsp:Transcript_4510/g.13682  ORF Transcript_4510/g.13682 Transcript_4510/m.13682 type:complete len:86 (+) Transcript_4510:141-398(+)
MSMIRTSLVSFLAGCVVSGGAGYFLVHQDIYRANGAVNRSIETLADKMVSANDALERRVAALETGATTTKSADNAKAAVTSAGSA